jgi:hypothetical protein
MKRLICSVVFVGCAQPSPEPCEGLPGECAAGDGTTVTTSWRLRSRGFEFGCAAFAEPEVAIELAGATPVETAVAPCTAGAVVSAAAAERYAITATLRSGDHSIRTANAQIDAGRESEADVVFRFDDFALGSEFAASFESAYCPRCGTNDPLGCDDAIERWACGDAGTCDVPTWGFTSELARCKSDVAAMSCSAQNVPESCAYFLQVLPGLVR